MPGPDSDLGPDLGHDLGHELGHELGHDLVAHLYAAALRLMHEQQQAFLPLNKVQEQLGWDDEFLGRVVDHCVRERPAITLPGAPTALTADWMDDGDRPAYGRSGVRFIGIRPAAPG